MQNADDYVDGRFSKDRPRFTDTLDVIKFLCKDLWMLVFRKQIDNLKTNHRVRCPYISYSSPSLLCYIEDKRGRINIMN